MDASNTIIFNSVNIGREPCGIQDSTTLLLPATYIEVLYKFSNFQICSDWKEVVIDCVGNSSTTPLLSVTSYPPFHDVIKAIYRDGKGDRM